MDTQETRPWYKKKLWWAVGGVLTLAVIGGAIGGTDSSDPVQTASAAKPSPSQSAQAPTTSAQPIRSATESVAAGGPGTEASAAPAVMPEPTDVQQTADQPTAPAQAPAPAPQPAAAQAAVPAQSPVTTTSAAPAPDVPRARQNAVRAARNYLSYSAFSRSGLIEQLEFEGYSTDDATYAVDTVDPDWNQQAARSAEQYLDYSAFSRQGLIEQLVFEGYTRQQAVYGADQAGI